MSSSERSIPHLRDIFSINSYSSGYNYTTQNPHNNPYNGVDHHANHHPSNNNLINQKTVSRKKRDNNKTLTSGDIKTLERHLSMKKTIRKKIMRDLQQMYTDDPNEFKTENTEQLKAEVRTDVLRFGERQTTASKKSDNFLDMLRGENTYLNNNSAVQRHDYDYDSATSQQQKEKQSFWKRFTMKGKSNR